MPHTNRKKKSQAQAVPQTKHVATKRQEVLDTDGWTHIVETPRHRARAASIKIKENEQFHSGDFTINGVSYVNRTLEEMKQDQEYYQKQWDETDAAIEVKEKFASKEAGDKDPKVPVDSVVCLGLGSLQGSRREGRRASHTQLAALRTIIAQLETVNQQPIKCTLQDPQFTPLDKEFLSSLGYTIVEDPLAFSQIDEHTLVYAIHCYARVYGAVSAGPRPAIMIGTDVGNFGRFDVSEETAETVKKLEDLVKGCEESSFPQLRHDFSDTKIYWRKKSETAV